MAERFDVFLSYSRRDAGEWSRVLAENLERLGVRVWWDGWEVRPGDVSVTAPEPTALARWEHLATHTVPTDSMDYLRELRP